MTDRASTDYQFDHRHESAAAGYYQVLMKPWNINAELTASTHCGDVRFTFPPRQQGNIILPISFCNTKTLSSHVRVIDNQTISGDVTCQAFYEHKGITVYFVMAFSKPFATHGTWTNGLLSDGGASAAQNDPGTTIGFYGSYPSAATAQQVDVRIGVSYVDADGALANLKAEMPEIDFDLHRQQTLAGWNKELGIISVEGGTRTHNRIFYTALYHSMLAPLIFDDVDGRYRGFDEKIHRISRGHDHFYATFSGWDIYRTEMPLLALIEPQRVEDMAQSLVDEYEQIGYIDRWTELNRTTGIMNGNPLTIVLVNAWNAGLRHFDVATAYDAMLRQARPGNPHSHLGAYEGDREEKEGVTVTQEASVSTALEHYLAFAATGNLAKALNKPNDATYLYLRAMQYRFMFNKHTGFLERKTATGNWDDDPKAGYTEGNKWIYTWFVSYDIQGLIKLMGGPGSFEERLDTFLSTTTVWTPENPTGEYYDPTNETDLQVPFLYDYLNRPWKTQRIVARTADRIYKDKPSGLALGNDDLGTLSAWYVLSQLGFYPVDPGVPDFEICTPRFAKITIHLSPPHSGKEFIITTQEAGPENIYIQSSMLNGKSLTKTWFPENEITSGGSWEVKVGSTPNTYLDGAPYDPPYSLSSGYAHLPANTN